MIARRLDHVHLVVKSCDEWVPLFRDLLGLQIIRGTYPEALDPTYSRPSAAGAGLAEFQFGDGFIAVMQPAPSDTQMSGFVDRRGEGFYALSFDAGNLNRAAEALQQRGVSFIDTRRPAAEGEESTSGFLWISPRVTHGTAVQLTWPWPVDPGANPRLLGLRSAVVAVDDVEQAAAVYAEILDLKPKGRVQSERFGYAGVELSIGDSPDTLVVAKSTDPEKPLGQMVARRGAGIFQFTLAVNDIQAEVERLRAKGVAVDVAEASEPHAAWIDPAVFRGVRIELREEI